MSLGYLVARKISKLELQIKRSLIRRFSSIEYLKGCDPSIQLQS